MKILKEMKLKNNIESVQSMKSDLTIIRFVNRMYCKLTLIFIILGFTISQRICAQDLEIDEDGEIQTGEIIIEKDRTIVLPQARKLYEKVKAPEFKIEASKIDSKFRTFEYSPMVELPKLRAVVPKTENSNEEIYDHYFKVGYGNFNSPLIQADLNLITDKDKSFRAKIDHLSFGKGAKDGKNSASGYTNAGIDGKVIGDNVTFTTGVGYTTTTDHFYGYQEGLIFDPKEIRHKYDNLGAYMGIEDNDAKNDVDYSLQIGYNSLKDNFSASESLIDIGAGFNYGKTMFLDGQFILSKYKQTSFDLSRNFFRVNPYYRLDLGDGFVDVGFSFSSISGGTELFESSAIFPYAKVNYSVSRHMNIFAQLDGGMSFNSYADYVRENPFLGDDLAIQSSRVNYKFKAGTAIKPIQQFALEAYVQVQSVKNMGMFYNALPDTTDFQIVYIAENTNVFEFGSRITININPSNNINLSGAIMTYSSEAVSNFYNLPTSTVELGGNHRIMDKLTVGWQFNLINGLNGVRTSQTALYSLYDGLVTSKLSAITELNLNLDYQINERIGAFLQFNNILNKNYEQYFNYPMRGLQAKAGVSFRL
ncbi:MAG: hypothetical protein ACJA2S_002258 [Cyclobacteriaceae bacterium]|jgi:hypothetical protein